MHADDSEKSVVLEITFEELTGEFSEGSGEEKVAHGDWAKGKGNGSSSDT